ncbi:MAG: hypothetical protein ACTSRI_00535 [Promethearchaeota archaeon]
MFKILNDNEIDKIKKEIEKEFPNDLPLQQIHIARKILAKEAELKGMKYLDYIKSITKNLETIQ